MKTHIHFIWILPSLFFIGCSSPHDMPAIENTADSANHLEACSAKFQSNDSIKALAQKANQLRVECKLTLEQVETTVR